MIKTFSHKILGTLRALTIDKEPYFSVEDSLNILHLSTTENLNILIKEDTPLISYPDLTSIILLSKEPHAAMLSKWIKEEIIPKLKKQDQQPTVFTNPEFGDIRVITIDNEPWFVGKDVAKALGYGEGKSLANAVARHVDTEDKGVTEMMTPGGKQQMTIINESGLYSLILSSKLPSAKKFKHWVTSEVLPSLRKTGGYVYDDEAFISTYLPFADEVTQALFKTQLQITRKQNEIIAKQKKQLKDQEPQVSFAQHVHSSDTLITITDMAQLLNENGIDIGKTRLFEFLRGEKILISAKNRKNKPYQKYIKDGYFKLKEKSYYDTLTGLNKLYTQTMVTGKGQEFIYRLVTSRYNTAA